MDIARPEFKQQKRRKQIIWLVIGIVCLGAVTIGVSHLKPAAPEVERSTVWTDTVKRGPMLRQVRGLLRLPCRFLCSESKERWPIPSRSDLVRSRYAWQWVPLGKTYYCAHCTLLSDWQV